MADFRDYIGMDASAFLMHYGKGHLDGGRSGRYPYGSTDNVNGGPSTSAKKKTIGGRAKSFFSDNNVLPYPSYKKLTDREIKAADIGLKALHNLGETDGEDINAPYMRDWFMWEDQTFGFLQVADMAAQGKSKTEINLLLECASAKENLFNDVYHSDKDAYKTALKDVGKESETLFMLNEFNAQRSYSSGNEYINECLKLTDRKPLTEKRFNELKKTIDDYAEDMKDQARLTYKDDPSGLQETEELIEMECMEWVEALEKELKK